MHLFLNLGQLSVYLFFLIIFIITEVNSDKTPICEVLDSNFEVNSLWSMNAECAFSSDYQSARNKFIFAAIAANAEVEQFEIVDSLYTDVAILRGNSKKFIVHISGVHGVEGYAGSAAQTLSLLYLAKHQNKSEEFPTIIFVHILNPFGMSNNRRVNEDNIDLNRNFLTTADFARVLKRDPNFAGYVDLDFLFNPSSSPFPLHANYFLLQQTYGFLKTTWAVAWHGLLKLKRALVSGNYYKQSGLGFGGFRMSKSGETLLSLLQREGLAKSEDDHREDGSGVRQAQSVTVIDVHTGLGPRGVDSLSLWDRPEQEIEDIFPKDFGCGQKGGSPVGGLKSGDSKGEGD